MKLLAQILQSIDRQSAWEVKAISSQIQRFAFRFAPYVCQLAVLKVQNEFVGWTRADLL
jgi:hypothetical protein